LTAEELLKRLEGLGLAMDRRTLTNYIKWQLVTAPEQRTGGKGVKADYPEEAVAEAAAAAELMKQERWRKEDVAESRAVLLSGEEPKNLILAAKAQIYAVYFAQRTGANQE
jgi:hypothetical protein